MDAGLLIIRVVIGALFALHGAGKLFGTFGAGYGIKGTAGYLEGFGFRPGVPFAVLVGLTELGAGLLFGTGFLTPLAAAAMVGVMLTAARTDHAGKGPWIFNNGWEYVLTIGAVAVGVAATGPGAASVDELVGSGASGAAVGGLALAGGLVGSVLTLALRRRPALVTAVASAA
jgi:putative oxidoreductase